jgi:hypothetical protein
MKKVIMILTTMSIGLTGISTSHAEESFFSSFFSLKRQNEVAPVTDQTYLEECGDCHFAYQPGLLPEASWRKLLDAKALEDHFGDNAELDEETRLHILEVLVNASADKSYYKRSRKIMASLGDDKAPLRITEVPYIKRKHHEIPAKLVKDNPKVESLSQCNKCHAKAKDSVYDDDTVVIPGYGNWTW